MFAEYEAAEGIDTSPETASVFDTCQSCGQEQESLIVYMLTIGDRFEAPDYLDICDECYSDFIGENHDGGTWREDASAEDFSDRADYV